MYYRESCQPMTDNRKEKRKSPQTLTDYGELL